MQKLTVLLLLLIIFTSSTLLTDSSKVDKSIITLSKKDLIALSKSEDNVWIYTWASWCKPCIKKLPDLVSLSKERTIIFLSIEADGTKCQKLLEKNGFEGTSYVLNPKQFKHKKPLKVQAQLKKLFGVSKDPNLGVPQNYLFKDEQLEQYKVGNITVK